jgi:hypothetical protein
MTGGCAISKRITSSAVITPGGVTGAYGQATKTKLIAVYATKEDDNATNTVKIWDSHDNNTTASDEVIRIELPATGANLEFDMHGALLSDGIYVEISGSGSCGITVCWA